MGEEAGHNVFVRSFPGYRADAINYHVIPRLYEYDIDAAIIHAGTNNLHLNKRHKNEKPQDVAKEIIGIGLTCKKAGVNDIFISSLVLPEHYGMRKNAREINNTVKHICEVNGFYAINNDNIPLQELYRDGIHLLDSGRDILTQNYIYSVKENLC